jgi:hypothetical protein
VLRTLRRAITIGLLTLSGCSRDVMAPREAIDSLIITTSTSTIATGSGIQLGLMVFGVSGQLIWDEPSTWSSDDPDVAAVSPTGFVSGVSPGVATITAHAGGKSTTIIFLVLLAGCTGADGDELPFGGNIGGTLTTAPCFLSGGYIAFGHILRVTEAGYIQADINSVGFHPSLLLTSASGGARRTAQSANARTASLRAPVSPGTYIIWAATLGGVAQNNSYTISVLPASGNCPTNPAGSISAGQVRSFALSTDSCQLLSSPVVEGWRLSLASATRVRLVAASADAPPMVALTSGGELITFSDAAAPGSAELTWLLPAGEYEAWAGSFWSSAASIDVSLEEIEICESTLPLALGAALPGTFADGDCRYDRWLDRHADAYLLSIAAPTAVQIDVTSASLDPVVFVTALDGTPVGQDDDSGEGQNARLSITLPAGTYRVWAAPYDRGETGAYTISANVQVTGVQTDVARPSALGALAGASFGCKPEGIHTSRTQCVTGRTFAPSFTPAPPLR